MNARTYSLIASIASLALTWLLLFVLALVYQTLAAHDPPIEFSHGDARAWNDDHNDMTISYRRDVKITDTTDAELHREVTCFHHESIEVYALQILSRQYVRGEERNIDRLVSYPSPQPLGTKCRIETAIKWWPVFSMKAHIAQLPPIEFVVEKTPYAK